MAAVATIAITDGVALQFRQEIDDFVADSALRDALAHLQDFVSDFAPARKHEVLLIRTRYDRWRASRRTGGNAEDNISVIRGAVLDLSDQIFDDAMRSSDAACDLVSDGKATDAAAADETQIHLDIRPAAPTDIVLESPVPQDDQSDGTLADLRRTVVQTLRGTDEWLACSCREVTHTYRRRGFALQPINLDLRAGEITGVAGRNGSGKTTLMRLLMGDLKPQSGTITYPSLTRDRTGWGHIKSQIAFVPQLPDRWNGRLRHTLNFVAAANAIPGQNVREVVAWHLARYGLEPFADATWDEISGGYKIRFELVRALVSNPKILFLDEPLAYLDIIARARFLRDLTKIATALRNPMPIVITSQHLHEVEMIADQIVVLEDGACKYNGPTDELGQSQPESLFEISLHTSRKNIESALQNLGLRRLEQTLGGYILALPRDVDPAVVFQRLSASFGGIFTGMQNVTNSVRSLMSEDLQ